MAHYYDFIDTLDELAQKAYGGDYGDSPFDTTTPGGEALFRDAYEKVGAHDPESWFSGSAPGGAVLEDIRARYDSCIIRDDVDNPFVNAFDIVAREQAAIENAPPPKTMDDVIREADDKQQQVDLLATRNEAKIEAGKPITALSPKTMQSLRENGVDVSALEKQFGASPDAESPAEEKMDWREIFESLPPADEPLDGFIAPSHDDASSVEANTVQPPVSNAESEGVQNRDVSHNDFNEDSSLATVSEADLVVTLDSGETVSFSDILAEICDDDEVKGILAEAVAIVDRGEDPRPFMEDAIADYEARHTAGADVEHETNDATSPDGHGDTVDASEKTDPVDDDKSKYEAKFEEHSEKLEARRSLPAQIRGDFFKAYHEMGRVYNAHKGGIEIEGKIPTKVDVAVSVLNFARSNILETLVIDLIRNLVEKKEEKDHVETPEAPKVDLPTDRYGIQENGDISRPSTPEEAKDIASFRGILPEAGKMYGADMSKVDRGSTADVTIRTTNPDGINGRGVAVTLDDAKKYTFPDVRLVDIKGERVLVDPFGKVMEVVSDGEKYKVGQTLSGLDVSARGQGREALETYARDNGLSIDQAKDAISHDVKERFCERIESESYKVESAAIEKMVIPRELEMKADLQSKLANLERIEVGVSTPEGKAEVAQMKNDVSAAIKTIDDRIDTLRGRQADLEHLGAKPQARSTNDRFSDAVSSEKNAVGRSVFTTDLGIDRKKIDERVSSGVEAIKARVEAHNATVPERDRISYDSKTGDFVDRFGISDKGEYVGNTNGRFMEEGVTGPATKEEAAKYVETHMDPSRFADTDKILATAEIERPVADIEKPEPKETERPEGADITATENPEIERLEAEATEPDKVGSEVEQKEENDPDKVSNTNVEQSEDKDTEKPQEANEARVDNTGAEAVNADKPESDKADKHEADKPDAAGTDKPEAEGEEKVEAADSDVTGQVDDSANDATIESTPEDHSLDHADVDATTAEDVEKSAQDDESENKVDATQNENTDQTENSENVKNETDNDDASHGDNVDDETEDENALDEIDEEEAGPAEDSTVGEDSTRSKDDIGIVEDDVDDVDDVSASEENNGANANDEDAVVKEVDATAAVEGHNDDSASNSDEDLAVAVDAGENNQNEDDDDKNNWLDDLKGGLEDYIEGCMKQITDPIGYEADKVDAQIDQICDLIDMLGGDASGLREAAHELVSSAVECITNAGDPTAQEAMKEACSHLFEELGFKLEDPRDLFEPLMNEYNDAVGTENEELVDNLTDSFCDGANQAEAEFNDVDADFDSVHLDDDTLVTQDGVVDEIGQTTGGIDDENAGDIEQAINDATAEQIPQEIENLGADGDPATVEDVTGMDDVAVETIEPPDIEMGTEDSLPEVDLDGAGVDAGGAMEEAASAGEAEMAEEIIEIIAALL